MEEVFVMGHRLVVFLKHALRRHVMFDDVETYDLRKKRQQDLEWIQNRLEVVALRIDEEEWNQYILRDLNSHLSKEGGLEGIKTRREQEESKWENFSGWTTAGVGEFAWEDAHDISFETSTTEDEEFDEDEGYHYEDEEYLYDEAVCRVIEHVEDTDIEVEAVDDEDSEHSNHAMRMLEADDYSLWHITSVEEATDDGSHADQSADRRQNPNDDFATINIRRTPVKALTDVLAAVLKRPPRQDPPGMYLSKINCFSSHRPDQYNYDTRLVVKDDRENETISTAPSDEDETYPRWRSRFEAGDGSQRLEYAPETSSRFRAYS